MTIKKVPRIEAVETTAAGLRVLAVRRETATEREDWRFIVTAASVVVEDCTIRRRLCDRQPWESSAGDPARLSDADRRELRALAGQAIARSIRRVEWAGSELDH